MRDTTLPKILLVEDNVADARLVQELLREAPSQDFDIVSVDTLDLALATLAKQRPDVLLLDLHLPDSSGLGTLLRCRAAVPGVPIVILSGLEDEALCLSAMRQGAQDYLVKGQITGPSLSRALRYAIERSQTMQATTAAPVNGEIRRHLDILQAEHALLLRLLGQQAPAAQTTPIDIGVIAADRYHILQKLGEGTSGVAYLAQDQMLERRVVLKALRAEGQHPASVRAFMKEARLAASIEHPNIVRIYDFGYAGPHPFLVMEWAEGGSLKERLDVGPLEPRETARTVIALLEGLASLHARGILHRDVKPPNLLFGRDGVPKLADFGLALSVEPTATRDSLAGPTASAGSPAYMSPEAAEGANLTPQSDLYSVGALMYEMLTGRSYLDLKGRTWPEMRRAIVMDPPRALPATVPSSLARVVKKALEKSPEKRFASTELMCRELARVAVKLEADA